MAENNGFWDPIFPKFYIQKKIKEVIIMYKALEKIGGYKIGDIVPGELAVVWDKMYAVSPVEKVENEVPITKKEKKTADKEERPKKGASSPMLDDYLSRNKFVVKKNINNDPLKRDILEALLELEKSNKNRSSIIAAIEKKLKGVEQ